MFREYTEDCFQSRPEFVLGRWRDWYDVRKENQLPKKFQTDFIMIYETLKRLTDYDRRVLTERYFNLKNDDVTKSSFERRQRDKELAKKFKLSTSMMVSHRRKATDNFVTAWKQVEVDKQTFLIGDLVVKPKILSEGKYQFDYVHVETDELIKTDVIELNK